MLTKQFEATSCDRCVLFTFDKVLLTPSMGTQTRADMFFPFSCPWGEGKQDVLTVGESLVVRKSIDDDLGGWA